MPARKFRPAPKRPAGGTPAQRKAKKILGAARRTADKITRAAEEAERRADYKLDVLDKLLPTGFTQAQNPELLPEMIQEKCRTPVQEVLDSAQLTDFIPTPAQRERVYELSRYGAPLDDILKRLKNPVTGRPISRETFMRHFQDEYEMGQADGNVELAKVGFDLSVGRPAEFDKDGNKIRDEVRPNPSVVVAALKHRNGWGSGTKKVEINHTHTKGVDPATARILDGLTDDELRVLKQITDGRNNAKSSGTDGVD